MSPALHIGIAIARPADEVYAFVSDPRNLPLWAAGLATSEVKAVEGSEGEWAAEAPFGRVRIRFAPRNAFGVLDHDVVMDSGETFHNPMRVMSVGAGSEFVFTLLRREGMTDAEFAADRAAIEADLRTLKGLLEGGGGRPPRPDLAP